MRQTASPIRTATHRQAAPAARALRGSQLRFSSSCPSPSSSPQPMPRPLTISASPTPSSAPSSSAPAPSDNFYMRGATVDLAASLFHGIGPVVSLNGMAVTNLRSQIDIHQASFLFGGRYTYSFGHISPTVWSLPRQPLRRRPLRHHPRLRRPLSTGPLGPATNTLTNTATGFTYSPRRRRQLQPLSPLRAPRHGPLLCYRAPQRRHQSAARHSGQRRRQLAPRN